MKLANSDFHSIHVLTFVVSEIMDVIERRPGMDGLEASI